MNKGMICPCCGRKYNLKALRKRRSELWEEYALVNTTLNKEIEKAKKNAVKKMERYMEKNK